MKGILEVKTILTKEAVHDVFKEVQDDDNFDAGKFLIELICESIRDELKKSGRKIAKCKDPIEINVKIKTSKK